MPLPNPSSFQNKDEYIGACMSKQKDESKPHDQKLAICFSEWRRKNESNIIQKINSLIGDETTTSGIATNTACGHIGMVSRQERKRKRKQYHMGESASSPKPGDRFEYKGKKLTIKRVGSGLRQWHDEYITVRFDGEKNDRDIKIKNFFKGNDFKYINEKKDSYIYVKHIKKNKMLRIANNPEVIKKYKDQGYELVESIFGATVAGTEIAGSGQTRAVGSYEQEVSNMIKPIKYNKFTGHFMPDIGIDADKVSAELQEEPPPAIKVVEKINDYLGESVRWKYKDARGVWQTGVVVDVSDHGGSDVTYEFKNDKTGKIDVVSGSRLKDAKALYGKPKEIKR